MRTDDRMEEIYAYLPQLVKMILFYSWGDIVRHFAQHSWRYGYIVKSFLNQQESRRDYCWLTFGLLTSFGKHQEYLHRREEEWTVDCIPVVLDNGDNIDLKIDWNSFRRSILAVLIFNVLLKCQLVSMPMSCPRSWVSWHHFPSLLLLR